MPRPATIRRIVVLIKRCSPDVRLRGCGIPSRQKRWKKKSSSGPEKTAALLNTAQKAIPDDPLVCCMGDDHHRSPVPREGDGDAV
jgi:hypothetical protein